MKIIKLKKLHNLFIKIVNDFPELIGDNLVGIYIYGSLTLEAFNKKSSDVDCVVVLNRSLNSSEFRKLNKWYQKSAKTNLWVERLEMSYLVKKDILKKDSKISIYHNGLFKRSLSDGNPIIWINVLKSGIILYGKDPKIFVPKISKEKLRNALRLELKYLKRGIGKRKRKFSKAELPYQAYAILTVCRIFYTFKYNTVVSKQQAANWCLKNLPKEYNKVIELALKNIYNSNKRSNPALEKFMPAFIDFIDKKLS